MQLHYQTCGQGEPLLILHGLFGSGDNWLTFARNMSDRFRVILPDQRNHGQSPHAPGMSYPEMAADALELIQHLALKQVHMVGHSMGGKTAMELALIRPDMVGSLTVVDIAPKPYGGRHDAILKALTELWLPAFDSRHAVETYLAPIIPDPAVRRFLLKSLSNQVGEGLKWKIGLREIAANYDRINSGLSRDGSCDRPVLFVRGQLSSYIQDADIAGIRRRFPKAELATIPGAGHWVHSENPRAFEQVVRGFLDRNS